MIGICFEVQPPTYLPSHWQELKDSPSDRLPNMETETVETETGSGVINEFLNQWQISRLTPSTQVFNFFEYSLRNYRTVRSVKGSSCLKRQIFNLGIVSGGHRCAWQLKS